MSESPDPPRHYQVSYSGQQRQQLLSFANAALEHGIGSAYLAAIKEIDTCGESLCTDLRIVGPESGPPDFDVLAPLLTLVLSGNAVKIGWGWQGFGKHLDQCEIQVDRADGKGWQVLTFDTTPGYTDTTAHPTALTQWKYRAIYRVDDEQVGQWSAEASIAVGG